MRFYHKFSIKSDANLCMIQCFPSGIVNCIHYDLVQFITLNTWLTCDSSCRRITSGNGTVIK